MIKNEIYLTLNQPILNSKSKHHELKSIRRAARQRGFVVKVIPSYEIYEITDDNVPYGVINMSGRPTTSHLRLLRELELRGCKTINPIYSSSIADDKMLCYLELTNAGFPVPKTMNFDVWYLSHNPEEALRCIQTTIGFPCVVKIPDAGLGWGVHRVNSFPELQDLIGLLTLCTWRRIDGQQTTNLIIQEYIHHSVGRAVRSHVIGGKCLGAFVKTNTDGWKSPTVVSHPSLAPHRYKFELSPELEKMSVEICNHFKLGCAGIDFLFTETGLAICEINTSPNLLHFDMLFPEINTADLLIEYLINNNSQYSLY